MNVVHATGKFKGFNISMEAEIDNNLAKAINEYFHSTHSQMGELELQSVLGKTFIMLPNVFSHIQPSADYWAQCILDTVKKDARVLDMGCGCGLVSVFSGTFANKIRAVDINPYAVKGTKINCILHGIEVTVYEGDLFAPIQGEQFDLIYFNPPWFKEEPTDLISKSWFSGKDGEVIDSFLKEAKSHLMPKGIIYLYTVRIGGRNIIEKIALSHGYTCGIYGTLPFLGIPPYTMDFGIIKLTSTNCSIV